MTVFLIILNILILILLITLLLKYSQNKSSIKKEEIEEIVDKKNEQIKENLKNVIENSSKLQVQMSSENQRAQTEAFIKMQESQQEKDLKTTQFLNEQFQKISQFQSQQNEKTIEFQRKQFDFLSESNSTQQQTLMKTLQEGLQNLQKSNEEKLEKIQGVVNEKLDKTLNERLDSNFKQIGDQLGELYKSLGELNKLSSGVTDLNKTLSNVKTRGTWGEIQLQAILEQTMTQGQYDTNVATKKNSNDKVEFAIKIPSKDNGSAFIYLPIDSKMPSDIYNRIVDASIASNQTALSSACKELETRIKQEAKTIRDKYIDPPNTTDFAIMFLPTEGLYAEALRINGLAEWCQTNCRIIISGPTTITALLNSLRIGFSNLALTKKSQEVLQLLQAIKTQYTKFDTLIEKTQKKLNEAITSTEDLKKRSDIIQRRMSTISELEIKDANNLLGIEENNDE